MVILAFGATNAIAATDPRAYQSVFTQWYVRGIRACRNDCPEWFVTESDRRFHTTIAHMKALAATHLKIAVANVHVAMTYTAVLELEQDFGAFWNRCRMLAQL